MDLERRTLLGLAIGALVGASGARAQTVADGGRAGPADPTEIIRLWPDGAPGWHARDVRVKKHAATLLVRARTGYDAGARNDIPHTAPHGAGAD